LLYFALGIDGTIYLSLTENLAEVLLFSEKLELFVSSLYYPGPGVLFSSNYILGIEDLKKLLRF